MLSRKGLALVLCLAALGMTPSLAAAVPPLCEGVDACALDWFTLPEGSWVYQTAVSFDGVDALQSGPTADGTFSGVGAMVVGPATVSCMGKVSSEEDSDYLALMINGEIVAAVSGEVDWFPIAFDLPEGTHQVAVLYNKDDSGSAGADMAWIDKFVIAPAGSIVINNGAVATASTDVTLNLAWANGSARVTRMRFSNNGSTWSPWEPLASTKLWTLLGGDGVKTVRVQYRDIAGNVSERLTDTIKLDTTPPAGGIVINNGAWITTSLNVTLNLNWNDGAGGGVSRMRFSNNGSTWSAWETVAPTKAWTLSGWGVRTVRAQFIDRAGNVSDVSNDYINAVN